MDIWEVRNDKIYKVGEQDYLGVPYGDILSGKVSTLPKDFDGYFPFLRLCNSLGDYAIVSGLFEAMKHKYPNCKIYTPSKEYRSVLLSPLISRSAYSDAYNPVDNMEIIWKNNPYIDGEFEQQQFSIIFTDHYRSYTALTHDGDMVRSIDEPLCEQILRRFGFTDEDLAEVDPRPKLYFSDEEIEEGEKIIQNLIGSYDYGCLLFASRLSNLKGRWEKDHLLYPYAEIYSQKPIFYFSEFDLTGTEWADYFPTRIDFSEKKIPLRVQLYIKSKALFNISYQAGFTDAVGGSKSRIYCLSPHNTIRENIIRGVTYKFFDGSEKILPV